MAAMQTLVKEKNGPLPLRGTFTPNNDEIPSLFLTGTAFNKTGAGFCTIELIVYDDKQKEVARTTATVYANEANQHKTLETVFTNQKPFQFGVTYSWVIQPGIPSAAGDQNDTYSAIIWY